MSFYLQAKKTTLVQWYLYGIYCYDNLEFRNGSEVLAHGETLILFIVENKTPEKGNIDRIHFLTSAFSD